MSEATMQSYELGRVKPFTPMFDKYALMPILACIFAAIISPLSVLESTANIRNAEPGLVNRLFWPVAAAVSIGLIAQNYSRLSRITLSPHMICLLAYVAFAAASTLWAFKPGVSAIRFMQQLMVLTSIVLPAMLAARTTELMRGVFLCFALGAILNVFFLLDNRPDADGYQGYFGGKNYLGEFSTVVFLLSLHEILYPGFRRVSGIIIGAIAILLLLMSQSKTAFGLALICPFLAGLMLIIRKTTRVSLAIILMSIPFLYTIVSSVSGFNMNRVSYMLYGDSTFTGRTIIWDFAAFEIGQRPLFGWGYQSFWLVGGDAPSITEAPGFVKDMPNSHNGYYDTTLELGYIGYCLLLTFIIATIHAIGRVAERDNPRGWFMLSLALYIIIYNYLESFWMRGYEFMWVTFVILAVEISRHLQPSPQTGASYGPIPPTSTSPPHWSGSRLRQRIPMKPRGLTRSMHKRDRK